MTRTSRLAAALTASLGLALAGAARTADAGGFARPISGSPTSAGLAGAFAAIADDASALYANPAGMGFATPGVLASVELVVAPRTYVCKSSCPPDLEGESQDATAVAPVPVVGVLFKPGGADSSVTLGIGAWNSFGGILHWDKGAEDVAAVNSTSNVVFELGVGVGWKVDEHVSLGAAIRLGIGVFAVDTTRKPSDLEASAFGIGVGASAGIMVRPNDRWSLGLAWRSNLDVTTSGSGTLEDTAIPRMDVDIEHVQRWPQSVSLAATFAATRTLTLALQLDWTQWSRFESLDITFPGNEGFNASGHFDLDWSDQFAIRAGAQYQVSKSLIVRGGLAFDSSAVPDRTIERQYLDADKFGLAAGASIGLSKRMILDLGLNAVGGPARQVPDTTADVPGSWPSQRNLAPGDHNGQVFTLASGVRIAL